MANVRDSDTSLWLHNKLGTSGDLWSGGSICSQLSQDVLRNIKECFIDLQAQVKLKLLLSFLHIPRRNVEEWRVELDEILELAAMDSDQWVSMLAELLKVYPSTGTINLDIEENAHVFTDLVVELKKHTKKTSDVGMIPLECLYLNKNALSTVVGQAPQPAKHFTLKRKPKSAALRAELIQKSSDAANNLKKSSVPCGVPIRSRSLAKRMDDSTPLKGLPSRSPGSVFRTPPGGIRRLSTSLPSRPMPKTPAGRKDGGIKFLEITEQPIGFSRESKRRKKLQDESGDAAKKDKELQPESSSPTSQSTPEYAAGLVAPTITPQLSTSSAPLTSMPGITFSSGTPTQSLLPSPSQSSTSTTTTTNATVSSLPVIVTTAASATTVATPTTVVSSQVRENIQHFAQTSAAPAPIVAPQQQQQQQMIQQTTVLQPVTPVQATVKPPQPSPQFSQIQPQPQQRKGLSLTREQMQEAQEMFRTANKVTRPEKALILGFMAGARDNPCPHLGNIVTIKLSESPESVKQADGTVVAVVVEMHFQMNYNTGEWKRVRKVKKAEE